MALVLVVFQGLRTRLREYLKSQRILCFVRTCPSCFYYFPVEGVFHSLKLIRKEHVSQLRLKTKCNHRKGIILHCIYAIIIYQDEEEKEKAEEGGGGILYNQSSGNYDCGISKC
jgi:hypothetical protein